MYKQSLLLYKQSPVLKQERIMSYSVLGILSMHYQRIRYSWTNTSPGSPVNPG